jgi:phage baseplate assembly protein W
VDLDADLKTLTLPYPVASVASLRVRVNNVIIPYERYTVSTRRKSLSDLLESVITFKEKVKDYEPIVELRFVTVVNYCPKCLGLSTLDDFFIEGHGDIKTISKENLLLQQLEKIIITKLSSNTFHQWYGSSIHSFIGTKISDRDLLNSKIKEQIVVAVEKLKNVQKQMLASGRTLDGGELFGRLLGIDIEETDDPTIMLVTVRFTSNSNATLEYTQYLSLNNNARQRLALQ